MSDVRNQFALWYDFALQQIAGECYLIDDRGNLISDPDLLRQRLLLGNNNFAPTVWVNGDEQPNKLLQTYQPDPEQAILPGATRLTASQARYFLENWRIVHQHANDASGFSATLLQNVQTLEYTLAFRSTEFKDQVFGGDYERDVDQVFAGDTERDARSGVAPRIQ